MTRREALEIERTGGIPLGSATTRRTPVAPVEDTRGPRPAATTDLFDPETDETTTMIPRISSRRASRAGDEAPHDPKRRRYVTVRKVAFLTAAILGVSVVGVAAASPGHLIGRSGQRHTPRNGPSQAAAALQSIGKGATHQPSATASAKPTTSAGSAISVTASTSASASGSSSGGAAQVAPPAAGSAPTAPVKAGVPSGVSLKKYTGPSTITAAGTVIDGYDVTDGLDIQAAGVIVRNSRISGTGDYGVYVRSGSLTIQDSTIKGFDNSLAGDNYTATRLEVTAANDDGFKIGDNVTIQDSWCHDLAVAPGAHSDCGQVQTGVRNVVIRGNWLDPSNPNANSALFLAPDLGPSSPGPLLIENNTLGGGNYSLYCVDGNNGQYYITSITIRNNRFLSDAGYGPMTVNVPVTASGNVMAATGKSVD